MGPGHRPVMRPVINMEDLDLNLVWLRISCSILKWLFWFKCGVNLFFRKNIELKRVRHLLKNSLFNFCKGHVRNKYAKVFRGSKFKIQFNWFRSELQVNFVTLVTNFCCYAYNKYQSKCKSKSVFVECWCVYDHFDRSDYNIFDLWLIQGK